METRRILSRWSAHGLAAGVLLLAGCAGCIDPAHFLGAYHGTVVDADTGEPIEGAVVVVYWVKRFVTDLEPGGSTPHSVREAVTGPSGEFSIPARRDLDWNPFSWVERRWANITIYAVDYLPLSTTRRTVPGFEGSATEFDAAMMRGETIPLRRMEDPREQTKYESITVTMPKSLVPHLTRAKKRQEEKLKLDLIREHRKRRGQQ